MKRRRSAAVLAMTAIAGLAGCGSSGSDPAGVVQTYLHAFVNGDGQTACKKFTQQVATQLAQDAQQAGLGSTCAELITKGRNSLVGQQLQGLRRARVTAVSETGNTATVQVNANSRTVTVRLVKSGGTWLINQIPTPRSP